jgi:hypothetical protein
MQMILIKTALGATSIIAIWYIIYLLGILTERYWLDEKNPEYVWIWGYVLRTLTGIMALAVIGGCITIGVMAWAVGDAIWQCVIG